MFEKSDQRFLRALESEEEFENRLAKLKKARKQAVIVAIIGGALFFVFMVMSFNLAQRCNGVSQTLILFGPFVYLLNPLMLTIKAHYFHSEIRALMVFQKLRG
jgi:hypothetical protein